MKGRKEQDCGCAGCYTALHAMELYAEAFDAVGRLDQLQAFASENGPAFYGLPVNQDTITLQRQEFEIPDQLQLGDEVLVPLANGRKLAWSIVKA